MQERSRKTGIRSPIPGARIVVRDSHTHAYIHTYSTYVRARIRAYPNPSSLPSLKYHAFNLQEDVHFFGPHTNTSFLLAGKRPHGPAPGRLSVDRKHHLQLPLSFTPSTDIVGFFPSTEVTRKSTEKPIRRCGSAARRVRAILSVTQSRQAVFST